MAQVGPILPSTASNYIIDGREGEGLVIKMPM